MAIDLTGGSGDNVNFGDVATDGLTAMTFAFTLLYGSPGRFTTKGNDEGVRSWDAHSAVGGNIQFNVFSASQIYSRKTTSLDLTAGQLYRIVVTWLASPKDMEYWVNGVLEPDAIGFNGSVASIRATSGPFKMGAPDWGAAVGGDYSEVAIWDHVVPQWVREAYGKGMSPRFYRRGGIFYCKMVNTDYLIDEWGGMDGVNSGGANAPHPRIYYPAPSPSRWAPAPPTPLPANLTGRGVFTTTKTGRGSDGQPARTGRGVFDLTKAGRAGGGF